MDNHNGEQQSTALIMSLRYLLLYRNNVLLSTSLTLPIRLIKTCPRLLLPPLFTQKDGRVSISRSPRPSPRAGVRPPLHAGFLSRTELPGPTARGTVCSPARSPGTRLLSSPCRPPLPRRGPQRGVVCAPARPPGACFYQRHGALRDVCCPLTGGPVIFLPHLQ